MGNKNEQIKQSIKRLKVEQQKNYNFNKNNINNNNNYNNNNYNNNNYNNNNNNYNYNNDYSSVKNTTKRCPYCGVEYNYGTEIFINFYNSHVSRCKIQRSKPPSNYRNQNRNINPPSNYQRQNINPPSNVNSNPQMIGSLLLTDSLKEFLNDGIKELPRGKRDGTFEEKVDYLRYDISKKKIDFTQGAENLFICRDNVLENSMVQLAVIDLLKELKIIFTGEESSDAGGLIREWLTILFKEIMDEKNGLFERSDTEEVSYLINKNTKNNQETLSKYFFIGQVLAKALLENLTVNCCFNKVIYQLILGEKVTFNDMAFIDKQLYNSMKSLIKMKEEQGDNIALCEIYFSVQYEDDKGNVFYKDLIQNGNNILVTKNNIDLYIQKRIEYFTKTQLMGVKEIIKGINSLFSADLLKIFTSDQLGLLINGSPFIDVDDWRLNTQYKDYNDYDDVIINFWEIIYELTQEQLSNFLMFCTGSSRVPIGGFKSLESNRGQISKFEIVKIKYEYGKRNFLRVHTCFNRLDLPEFPDKDSLNNAIKFALENQVLGYGIE